VARVEIEFSGDALVEEITVATPRTTLPATATPANIGLVEISTVQTQESGLVITLDTPPASKVDGKLWWETDTGNLYLLYDDGNSQQWVQVNGGSSGVPEAPLDGSQYGRQSANWTVISGGGGGITEPPDSKTYGRKNGAWDDLTDDFAAKLNSSAYTAADVLAKLVTVDGTGSNLDADLLDGQSGAYYLAYGNMSGVPSTFPPTLPIAQSGVTNLVTDLAAKEPAIAVGTSAQYWQGTKSWQTLDKTAVGLSNVDNTSDAGKPVSTAQAAADALKVTKAGDTMSGDLSISKATATLFIDKAASGQEGAIQFRTTSTAAGLRWKIYNDTAAESAGNGSHFRITRYDDTGASLGDSITINRLTGNVATTALSSNGSYTSTSTIQAASGNAIPAGGATTTRITATSSSSFGLYFGSGVPTVSAAQGSIYLRSDGTGTNTRVYVNTNGTTGWSAMSVIATGTSAPASPAVNDVWIDTT
jgi:hypothetical protein